MQDIVDQMAKTIHYFEQPESKIYEYHIYEKKNNHSLALMDVLFFNEDLTTEQLKSKLKTTQGLNELNDSYIDKRIFWEQTEQLFSVWTFKNFSWTTEENLFEGKKFKYSYKKEIQKKLEVTCNSIKIFHRFSIKEIDPKNYDSIYNWCGKWRQFSGVAIGSYNDEYKILSLWNTYRSLPNIWEDFCDDEEGNEYNDEYDFVWTRVIGQKLSEILGIKWYDYSSTFLKE
jgi:hypothetical protein